MSDQKPNHCSCTACLFENNRWWAMWTAVDQNGARMVQSAPPSALLRCPRCLDTLNPGGTTTRPYIRQLDYPIEETYVLIPLPEEVPNASD